MQCGLLGWIIAAVLNLHRLASATDDQNPVFIHFSQQVKNMFVCLFSRCQIYDKLWQREVLTIDISVCFSHLTKCFFFSPHQRGDRWLFLRWLPQRTGCWLLRCFPTAAPDKLLKIRCDKNNKSDACLRAISNCAISIEARRSILFPHAPLQKSGQNEDVLVSHEEQRRKWFNL